MIDKLSVLSRLRLFEAGTLGYHSFRIPAVVSLGDGNVFVAAEARRNSVKDWGEIDVVVRQSQDGGKTFGPARVLITDSGYTCGNPTWLFSSDTHELALLFCKNGAEEPERLVMAGKAKRSVWYCVSLDGGATFSKPREITSEVKPAEWTWYATGPGHGITLRSGRWLVPCCHAVGVTHTHEDPVRSHLIVSDDRGATWRVGAIVDQPRSSECGVAEVRPNTVYADFRNDASPNCRGGAVSLDGGDSFSRVALLEHMSDPGCRGGITEGDGDGVVYVSHPRGPKRRDLVLERSTDGGLTFERYLELALGCAAYSDLARLGEGRLGCAFESGSDTPYETIDWLEVG